MASNDDASPDGGGADASAGDGEYTWAEYAGDVTIF